MFRGLKHYKTVYAHLWASYGSSWQVRLSYILQILSRICKLIALPIAISLIITRLSARDFDGAQEAVLIYIVFSVVLGMLSPLIKYIGMLGENKVYDASTGNYFSRLVTTDIEYFNSHLSGYLTSATRQYVDSCVQLVRALRDRYINTVLSIIFPLVVIIWFDLWLGLVTFILSAVQATFLLWSSHAIDPYRAQSRELFKRNSGHMADIISNILAVKSTAQEASYVAQVSRRAGQESDAFKRRYTVQAKLVAGRELITVTFFMILLWLTVERMSAGDITITVAVLVVTYANTILTGIYSLSDNLDEHDDLIDKIVPAFNILDRQNNINDPEHPQHLGEVRGELRLDNVSFAYENNIDNYVLEDFSLTIPAGQKVGIVGLSGAGKSTLTKLLLRFNDVASGNITLDGVDVRNLKQADLRSQIAYVPQEPLLFHSTIKDNVLVSRPNASDAEVVQALKAAHAYSFVKQLPDGVDSIVGERGVKLSGGQKQRIAIARAVLRKSPIMILDEATSALDSESEQIIKNSFSEILKGKTAIVIAHRLSTLSEMDRIVVIEKGKIIEDDSHNELLAAGGLYAKLWKRQLKLQED